MHQNVNFTKAEFSHRHCFLLNMYLSGASAESCSIVLFAVPLFYITAYKFLLSINVLCPRILVLII